MVRDTDIRRRTRGAKTAIQGLSPGRQVEGPRGTTTASLPQLRLRGLEGKKRPTLSQPTPGRALRTRQRARSGVGYEPTSPLCLPERLQNGGAAPACPRRLLPSAPPLRGPPRLGAGVPQKITRQRRAEREGAAFPSSSGSHERVKSDEDAPPAGQSEQAGQARGCKAPGVFLANK